MLSIGELAHRTGVKIPTIRYYEQMGLMEEPERSHGNQRRYTADGLRRLSFIRHARELGFSIEDIRRLSELSGHPGQPCASAHDIARSQLSCVRSRILRLKRLESELARIAALPDAGHVENCQVIEALADHELCGGEH